MTAVYRKELRSYLTSMIGYVFIAFILVAVGIYFAYQNLNLGSPRFELVLDNVQFIFLVFVPILTMRVLADEKKQRTDQLLLTLPLSVWDIVIGKFLALVTLYAVPVVILCFYPLLLSSFGPVNMPAAYFSILAFFLLGCADIAIGIFLSSLTENAVIAAVMTFGALLLCYLMSTISTMVPYTAIASFIAFTVLTVFLVLIVHHMTKDATVTCIAAVVLEGILCAVYMLKRPLLEGAFQKFLSVFYLNGRLQNFFSGMLDIGGILYYLSVMAIFLLLAEQTIVKRRWS